MSPSSERIWDGLSGFYIFIKKNKTGNLLGAWRQNGWFCVCLKRSPKNPGIWGKRNISRWEPDSYFWNRKKRIEYKDHRKACSQIFIMTYEEAKVGVLTTTIQRMTCRNFHLWHCCQSAQPPLRFLLLPCRLENSFSVMNLKVIVAAYWYGKWLTYI